VRAVGRVSMNKSKDVSKALRDLLRLLGVIVGDAAPCDGSLVRVATTLLRHPSPWSMIRMQGCCVAACSCCGTGYLYDPKLAQTICPLCGHVTPL